MDIDRDILRARRICLSRPIDDQMANLVIAQLLVLHGDDRERP